MYQLYDNSVGKPKAQRPVYLLANVQARLCVQYDVELVQHIESLIGHQLREFTLDEAQVLKGITRVYSAKRSVAVKALEDESRDDKHRQLIRRKSGPKKAKKVKGGTD